MDLSKAFDCLPHDLLIAKLESYGIEKHSLLLLLSYLQQRKQSVKVKGLSGLLQLIKSGVPQGAIFGPILFDIFINNIYFFFFSYRVQKEFIWDNKRPKIKHCTLTGDYSVGGYKRVDIETKFYALKCIWIKKFLMTIFIHGSLLLTICNNHLVEYRFFMAI